MSVEPVYLVGAGRVGTALAALCRDAGVTLAGLWSRSEAGAREASAQAGIPCAHGPFPEVIAGARTVILAVSDPAVPTVAGALLDGGLLRGAAAVLHCGGGRPARKAMPNLCSALPLGTFHPLVAVASRGPALQTLRGARYALEGDPEALAVGEALARRLGLRTVTLAGAQMALYHAAAVMASNHAVALWDAAVEVLGHAGIPRDGAVDLLLPLLTSTVENVAQLGPAGALTGPIVRGDTQTVAHHLQRLQGADPELARLYRELSRAALRTAARRDPPAADPAAWTGLLDRKRGDDSGCGAGGSTGPVEPGQHGR